MVVMGLRDYISDIHDRVMRRFVDTPRRNRFLQKHDIGVISMFDEDPAFAPHKAAVDTVLASGRFEDFIGLNDAAFAGGLMLANACPVHKLQRDYLWIRLDGGPGGNQHGAALWDEAYRRKPHPAVAAMLAYSLASVGWEHRGYNFDGPASDQDHALWREFGARARDIMQRHEQDGPSSRTWRRLRFSLSVGEDITRAELDARFAATWADDRRDTGLLAGHANALLPRWFGENEGDLDRFARQVSEETKDVFGTGAYALIYGFNTSTGSHEPEDTLVDPVLLIESFEDLVQRFPAPGILNLYVKTLAWLGDDRSLNKACAIARNRMKMIVPEVWDGDTFAEKLEDAEDTLDLLIAGRC
jgi:hypothetical protein